MIMCGIGCENTLCETVYDRVLQLMCCCVFTLVMCVCVCVFVCVFVRVFVRVYVCVCLMSVG